MVVLDTDVLIDAMRGNDRAVEVLQELIEGHRPVAVSAITIMQLHHGIARSTKPQDELKNVESSLEALLTYPLDGSVAARAGALDGELTTRGKPIGVSDTIIGATGLEKGESVLTRNVKHFERINDLHVETY